MILNKDRTRALVVSHFLIDPLVNAASSTSIRNFLLKKVKQVTQIEQPFAESKETKVSILVYEDGRIKKSIKMTTVKKPTFLVYVINPIILVSLKLRHFSRYDVCIACDNLSFISMLPFRKLGIIKRLIYYSVDYVEERFQNKILNTIYHVADRLACKHSDVNWVVVKEQINGRKKNGVVIETCSPFEIVPIGFRNSEIDILPLSKIDSNLLIFVGGLRPSAGPQIAISSLNYLQKKFPKIKLAIIGGGSYQEHLKILAKELGVEKRVKFYGFVKSHKKLVKIITRGAVGLAPYTQTKNSISYKSDPGKIKLYLACGLPVVTTKIATSGKVLEKKGAGIIAEFDEKGLSESVIYLLSNNKTYKKYRNDAEKLSAFYDVDRLMSVAFKNIPS